MQDYYDRLLRNLGARKAAVQSPAAESDHCLFAEDQVDSGDLSLSVAYRGFPIYTETKDLCDQTDCPVRKGPVKVDLEQPFPIITPPVRHMPPDAYVLHSSEHERAGELTPPARNISLYRDAIRHHIWLAGGRLVVWHRQHS